MLICVLMSRIKIEVSAAATMPLSYTYRHNALVVEHYTSGSGHSSAAHVVGGFKYRVIRTSLIHLSQLAVVSVVSLSANYMEYRDVTSNQLWFIHLSQWIGRCISSWIFGLLLDHLHHHTGLLAALSMVLTASAALLTAFSKGFYMIMTSALLLGICSGAVYMCCLVNILKLWNKLCYSSIHSLYAISSIGVLSSYFFHSEFREDYSFTDPDLYNTTSIDTIYQTSDCFEFELFCIFISLFCIILLVVCVILYCYERFKIHSFSGEVIHRIKPAEMNGKNSFSYFSFGKCTGGRSLYGLIYALFFFIIFLTTCLCKLFLLTIENCSNQSDFQSSALPNIIAMCSFTVSLILSSAYSHYISPHYLMYFNLCIYFFCSLFFIACQQSHPIATYFMHGLHAFTLAGIIPCFISWSHLYIEVNGAILSIGITGETVASVMIHYILNTLNNEVMKFIQFGCSLMNLIVFVIVFFIATKQGQRADSQNESVVAYDEDGDEKSSSRKAVSFSE